MKHLIVVFVIYNCSFVNNELINMFNYCGTTIQLDDYGPNSSISLNLTHVQHFENCTINFESSNTHLLYIRLVENTTEHFVIQNNNIGLENFEKNDKKKFEEYLENYFKLKPIHFEGQNLSCTLKIFQPEISNKTPIFETNPCSTELNQDDTLLGNKATLEFTPKNSSTHKWVLITAVGTGEYCFNPQMFSCWQQAWTPLLCISREFLCDGVVHCPTNGYLGDENLSFCKGKRHSTQNWEKLANDFLKKLTSKNKGLDTLLPAIQKGEKRWIEHFQTTTQNPVLDVQKLNKTLESPHPNMGHFGPWSYLMLGMLICGTLLTFCGLFECCCRKNKIPRSNNIAESPSVTSAPANSTAVLIMTSQPPKYDELDQPPSYKILFPEKNI